MSNPTAENGFAYFRRHACHQATQDGYSWYAFDHGRLETGYDPATKCACGEWFAGRHGYHWHDSGICHTQEQCS